MSRQPEPALNMFADHDAYIAAAPKDLRLCWFDCALNLRARCLTPKKSSPIICLGSGSENPSSRAMQRSPSNAASIYLLPPSSRMRTTLRRLVSSLPRLASPSHPATPSLTGSLRNSPWLPEGIRHSSFRRCLTRRFKMGRLNRFASSPNVRLRREAAGNQHGWQ